MYIRKGASRKTTPSRNCRLEEQIRAVPGVREVSIEPLFINRASDPVPELLRATGFKWEQVGTEKPSGARELTNPLLARALLLKTEFTFEEWDKFSVSGLSVDDFIKSDASWFRPASPVRRCVCVCVCVLSLIHI